MACPIAGYVPWEAVELASAGLAWLAGLGWLFLGFDLIWLHSNGFGLISAGFDLISNGFGLAWALSLAFSTIFAYSSLS